MQLKKKFVAVIGYGKSGKSTIISSLTGCRKSTFQDFITDKVTGSSIFVCSGSPQEDPKIKLSIIAKWLRKCNEESGCRGMVIAIQPTNTYIRASMEEIFKEAKSQGFDIYAFVVEPGYNDTKICYAEVVDRLTSIGVSSSNIFKINGKQFALRTSNAINSKAPLII